MKMTERERFKAIAHFQRPRDLYINEMVWPETLENWVKQGAPEQIAIPGETLFDDLYGNSYFREYFRHGTKYLLSEVKASSGSSNFIDLGQGIKSLDGCPLLPGYKPEIIAEDERTITYRQGNGQTLKGIKGKFAMPKFIDWPVKDRAAWKEHKKKLDPHTPGRFPADWDAYVKKMNALNDPVILQVGGFFGLLREWIGSENILYMFHDDPGLIEEMMEQMLYLETEIIKRVVKDIKVDQADYWEDMAYKAGPLISPDMVRKFMVPRYKKITDLLHSNGIDIIFVDCDGNVDKLIPLWLESGVNFVWPFEQAAGNDVVAVRKKYGKDLIIGGGIDKRELEKGKDAIRREVMSKVPFLLEQGGYFPTVDHLVPPDVSFENYCYYINTLREVAGLEKLSF